MFKILAFFTTCAGIGMGIKTGLSSYSNSEDGSLMNLVMSCVVHSFFWSLLFTLPVYLLQRLWWIAVIIIIIGVVIYSVKKKSSDDENPSDDE